MIIRIHSTADEPSIIYTVSLPSPNIYPSPITLPICYAAQLRALHVFSLPPPTPDTLLALDAAAGIVTRTHEVSFYLQTKTVEVVGIDGGREAKEMSRELEEALKVIVNDVHGEADCLPTPTPEEKKRDPSPSKSKTAEKEKPKAKRQRSRSFLKAIVTSLRSPTIPPPSPPSSTPPLPRSSSSPSTSSHRSMASKMRRRRARASMVDVVATHVLPLLRNTGGYPAWATSREIQRVETSMRFLEREAERSEGEMLALVRDMDMEGTGSRGYAESKQSHVAKPASVRECSEEALEDEDLLSSTMPDLDEDSTSSSSSSCFSSLRTPTSTTTSLLSPAPSGPPPPSPADLEAYANLSTRAAVLRNTLRHFIACATAAHNLQQPTEETDERAKRRAWSRGSMCIPVSPHEQERWTKPLRSSPLARGESFLDSDSCSDEEDSDHGIQITDVQFDEGCMPLSELEQALEDSIHDVPSDINISSSNEDLTFASAVTSMPPTPKLPTLDLTALKPATEWAARRLATGKGVFVDDDPFVDGADEETIEVSQLHVGSMMFGVDGLPSGPTVLRPRLGRSGVTWLPCISVEC